MAPPDAVMFRQLLGRFATGVTVATTVDRAGRPVGMTASAVAAVSLDPPLVLLCVSPEADFHAALLAAPAFALNVLADDQEALSHRFAADGIERFAGVPYTLGPGGLPLLAGALAHILCEPWGRYETVGDHTIFVGRVTGGSGVDGDALIHYRSGYTSTKGGG